MGFVVIVKFGNEIFNIEMNELDTILQLKQKLLGLVGLSIDCQRIVFLGRILNDNQSLQALNVQPEHFFYLVRIRSSSTTTAISQPIIPVDEDEGDELHSLMKMPLFKVIESN